MVVTSEALRNVMNQNMQSLSDCIERDYQMQQAQRDRGEFFVPGDVDAPATRPHRIPRERRAGRVPAAVTWSASADPSSFGRRAAGTIPAEWRRRHRCGTRSMSTAQ